MLIVVLETFYIAYAELFVNGYEFIYIYIWNTYYMYNTCNIEPGFSLKEMKIYVYIKTYTQMFIADL